MTCNYTALENHLDLSQEASCTMTFTDESVYIDVMVGRDSAGKWRAVGTNVYGG